MDVCARRLVSTTVLDRAQGYAPLPWGIDLLLTDACNLRCTYCPITTDMLALRPSAVMDTDQALRFLESVAHFRPMIRMFGGEPLLHPEWPRIFAHTHALGLPFTLVTNGTRIAGRAEELVRSGITAIGISVDPPAAHDRHRGVGSFALCRTAIDELRDVKARLGSGTPLIEIFTTVYEGTYAHLVEWADELRTWPIDMLRLQHQIWLRTAQRPVSEALIESACGDATFFRSDVDTYCSDAMPDVDAEVLERQLRHLHATHYPFKIELHPPLPVHEMIEFYRNPDFKRVTERPCTLISSYTFVDPRGRLYPCLTLDMGSVFDEPFHEVWNGEKFRAFRRLLREHERLPLCERCPA